MVDRILCALDFSHSPDKVLSHALAKAEALKVPVSIIFSYRLQDYERVESVVNLRAGIEARAREQFAQLEREILMGKGVPYQFFVEVGFLSTRIESHASKNPNQVLVISKALAQSMTEQEKSVAGHFFETLSIPVEYVSEVATTH